MESVFLREVAGNYDEQEMKLMNFIYFRAFYIFIVDVDMHSCLNILEMKNRR
jgi:hypothetical protein